MEPTWKKIQKVKHEHIMEQLAFERETELIKIETQWKLDHTTPQQIQQQYYPQQPQPQHVVPQQQPNPQYVETEEGTPEETSAKKYGGKKK
jgi:hypothetical protein